MENRLTFLRHNHTIRTEKHLHKNNANMDRIKLTKQRRQENMIKLVVSDIDGTLLPEGQTKLSPKIYQIIRELRQQNVHFTVASGRQLDSEKILFAPVADDISYISENGAICMHEGRKYVISELDRDFAMRIIEEVEKRPNCKLTISTPSTQYIKSGDNAFSEYIRKHLQYTITAIDSFQDITEPIVKISFSDSVTTQESHEHFQALFGKEIKVAYSGNLWIDFIPFDSNKGTALKFLLEKMNLTPSEAVAFGDQQNDMEMLTLTKSSYAMAHSKPEIQEHATGTTDSVEKTLCELFGIDIL